MRKKRQVPSEAKVAAPADVASPTTSPAVFLNRELAWLEFNRRVLHEACDERTPLLERLRFLGIFTSNLDEFFMKRVGGLKRQVAAGVKRRSLDGLTPAQQLVAIRAAVLPLLKAQADAFECQIKPDLERHGIRLCSWEQLSEPERREATTFFLDRVFPVLTPLAVDPGHPFPFISNLSTSLGVTLRYPDSGEQLFARIKIPHVLPQWVPLSGAAGPGRSIFISLLELISHHVDRLFPGMDVLHPMPFRVTRNADMERDEEDADDLLELIEKEVRQRRFERVVRLEHGPVSDPAMLPLLSRELDLAPEDVYALPSELDYTALNVIAGLPLPALQFDPWTPLPPPALFEEQSDLFGLIRAGDILVHHPYEDFGCSVELFVRQAAADPNVLAIKMTLYRTGDDSPFIRTLINAAEDGKQVVCLVELKARFEEERNIYWAQVMEKAGIHVVYGMVGLKTHAKITLVTRNEPDGLRCYTHIGTGNYNVKTARLYTDLGLFSADPALTHDVMSLFNHLTGRSLNRHYDKLLVAPIGMRDRFVDLIARESEHARAGRPAQIAAKMNSLEDDVVCRALYAASQAGVEITLIVRGFCCLKPGVPGMSECIRVLSVIGRFLEHSRIFMFRNGQEDPVEGAYYIGSADWMYRNLLARVEAVVPVESRPLRERLWEILRISMADERQAWDMRPDGTYIQRQPQTPEQEEGTHRQLMVLARKRAGVD